MVGSCVRRARWAGWTVIYYRARALQRTANLYLSSLFDCLQRLLCAQVEYVLNSCVGELVASASGQRGAAGARHGAGLGLGPGGTGPASQPEELQLQRVELLYSGAR